MSEFIIILIQLGLVVFFFGVIILAIWFGDRHTKKKRDYPKIDPVAEGKKLQERRMWPHVLHYPTEAERYARAMKLTYSPSRLPKALQPDINAHPKGDKGPF